jgi:hypothetical protein
MQLKNLKQKKIEQMEVYYDWLSKLVNNLQRPTTNNFLTIILKFGLQFYLLIAIVGMKIRTLQHKDSTLFFEARISQSKAKSFLLVPWGLWLSIIDCNWQPSMCYTNYHWTNHNVDTWIKRRRPHWWCLKFYSNQQTIKIIEIPFPHLLCDWP